MDIRNQDEDILETLELADPELTIAQDLEITDSEELFFKMAPMDVEELATEYATDLGCSQSMADYLAYVFASTANGSGYWSE